MSGVNKAILLGNLGRDPEMRYTQDGNPVCSFSIATSETWKDKNTNEKKEKTEWHRIVVFRQGLAEVCARYLKKGSKVYVEGKIQTSSYEKNGATHYITQIVANELTMLDSASKSDSQPGPDLEPFYNTNNNNTDFIPEKESFSRTQNTEFNPERETYSRTQNSGTRDQKEQSLDDDIPF